MRLEFYRNGNLTAWDVQENGHSLLGRSFPSESRDGGFFFNPNFGGPALEDIPELPLSKAQAVQWLSEWHFAPEGWKGDTTGLRQYAESLPSLYPQMLSFLLSSRGVQGERVQLYLQNIRAQDAALTEEQRALIISRAQEAIIVGFDQDDGEDAGED